jgi:hypothetical protein
MSDNDASDDLVEKPEADQLVWSKEKSEERLEGFELSGRIRDSGQLVNRRGTR